MNRIMRSFIVPGLIVAAALAVAATLIANPAQLESTAPETVLTTVRVREVAPESVRLSVHSDGTVAPRTESALVPEVSGRIVWISPALLPGGSFSEGEPLLRIDDRDYRTAVTRAQAQLASAKADREHADDEYRRQVDLDARKLTSRSGLDQTRRDLGRL